MQKKIEEYIGHILLFLNAFAKNQRVPRFYDRFIEIASTNRVEGIVYSFNSIVEAISENKLNG